MQILNGNEEKIVRLLNDYGLSLYEARTYFTLLTVGRAKVLEITRKASVPQSKSYEVLESLIDKGFVELTRAERPKEYSAKALDEVTDFVAKERERQIRRMEANEAKLQRIVEAVAPMHKENNRLRLFHAVISKVQNQRR
jgi:sugar-specific transcriptional regulator TrmB